MRHLLAALLVLLGFGCSILDPGDRDELRRQIAMLPPSTLSTWEEWNMNANAVRWLKTYKDDNDQVGKLQCRVQAGGTWSGWNDQEPTYTVADLLECLLTPDIRVTYTMCPDFFVGRDGTPRKNKILNEEPVPGVTAVECRFVWDFRYEPEKVPPNLTNPKEVTSDDLIDWMIGLPMPPPGWNIPEIIPLLCPLGAGPGWGCPPRPTDPTGGQPTDPTGGQPGDQP
jgi:hypothetical protein